MPMEGQCQSFTMSDGERFYVKLKDDESEAIDIEKISKPSKFLGLCGDSYSSLLEQAVQEQLRLQESSIVLPTSGTSTTSASGDSGIESSSSDEENSSNLWVEKFKPRSYMQLLSDDGTNRNLLHWLKLWDKMVFNRELPKKPEIKATDTTGATPNSGGDDGKNTGKPDFKKNFENNEFKKTFVSKNDLIEDLDDTGRPQQKTSLLYGPPGLGKTTLAHVVANHAGYNVVEINASDDRSLAAFKIRLDAATQMTSVNNKDKRPNCLVIDEIDGAPSPTITYLVSLLTGKAKKKSKKGKDSNATFLQRPIICICNDLYVPALRPLRQISLLMKFPPTSSQRLVQRLSFISGQQSLKTDLTALMALCEKSGNDIRSCLSTLQFFKSKGQKLSKADVYKTNVGNKDSTKSHFSVWEELFSIPRSSGSNKRKHDGKSEENCAALNVRFKNSLHMAQSCGDYEKLQQGVFENYLTIKFKDAKMQNVLAGNEWFCFFDVMHHNIMKTQTYATMAYLPYNFVATHLYFAASSASGRAKIVYPTQDYEMKSATIKSSQILQSLYTDMNPLVRCFSSTVALVRDIIPCVLAIVQPNLRPVNTQLFTKSEKELLQNAIANLVAYSLNFVQERSAEGQYVYKLDPNIEDVAYFKDINHTQLPYAIKQLIAHEVEKEKMRRSDAGKEPEVIEEEKSKTTSASGSDATKKELPNHLRQKLEIKQVEVKEHVPVDFFGRRIQPKKIDLATEAIQKANEIVSSDVWFKFKEGYNNAVRKNIKMKDLL